MEKKPQLALVKEEESKHISGFNGENLGPTYQPARVSSYRSITMIVNHVYFFFSFWDILISTVSGEEHNFQVKRF